MPIDSKLLQRIKDNDECLTALDLRWTNIGPNDAKLLINAIIENQTLKAINLEGNKIGNEGAKMIAGAIAQNKTLTAISLDNNEISNEGAKAIANMLNQNTVLKAISFYLNNIGIDGMKALANTLKHNKTLTALNLSYNEITNEGIKALANALIHNKGLTTLELWDNKIDDNGAKLIANAIVQNKTLTAISLDHNEIGNEGAKAIADALVQNKTLTELELWDNRIDNIGAKAIANILDQNRTLLSIKLKNKLVSADIEAVIQEKLTINKKNIQISQLISQAPLISRGSFTLDEFLGRGAYGIVYKGKWLTIPVAIKKLDFLTSDEIILKEFLNESSIMANLIHPNIVRLYGICMEENEQAIIMEYLPKNSLELFLTAKKQSLDWENRWQIALDIGKGLMYLHHKNVLHCDLKSANVLLSDQCQAKLSDFGLAKIKTASSSSLKTNNNEQQQSQQNAEIGTLRYSAPECFLGKYTKASDVYSYGMLLWELATGEIPFKFFTDIEIATQIQTGKQPKTPQNIPPIFQEWIKKCCSYQPENRPEMEAVVEAFIEAQAEMKEYIQSKLSPEIKLAEFYHISSKQIQFSPADKLGEGGFGYIYKGEWHGQEVAIKKLKAMVITANTLQQFEHETRIMSQIVHPNIIRLYGTCMEPNHYYIVMEYMPKGSLHKQLHSNPQSLSWPIRWKIALDIGKGLYHLHSKNILHRDLKSLNVLLDKDYTAKISDFGLSISKEETQCIFSNNESEPAILQTKAGTPAWKAPELFDNKNQPTQQSDIYSYGIILWELASGKTPYENMSKTLLMLAVGMQAQRPVIPEKTPISFSKLIARCWAQRAEDRPKIEEIIQELETKKAEADIRFEVGNS